MIASPRAFSVSLMACLICLVPAGCCAGLQRISQTWASSGPVVYGNTDSLAACRGASGDVLVFATAKEGNRLDLFNARSGCYVRSFGQPGTGPGEFLRPNGIAVAEFNVDGRAVPLLIIVERDNRRVQVVEPEELRSMGVFGSDLLNKPYGCALSGRGPTLRLFVTDTGVPAEHTVHMFDLSYDGSEVHTEYRGAFGASEGPGRLEVVESIVVDDATERVLICDEPHKHVKVYDITGQFTGVTFGDGLVEGDPEGLVVLEQPNGGVIVLTDQRPDISLWHVFDRRNYAYRGTFTGTPAIANTDGICVYPRAFDGFPAGAFFAVHDDLDVRGFDLQRIYEAIAKMAARQ